MSEVTGLASNLVDLPRGGGALSPLGDRFEADLAKGSGSYSIPIPLPAGPGGLRPALSLVYSTGHGNGPLGVGWRLEPIKIQRRCDRGVPRYTGDDQFVLGAEVLVDVGERWRPRVDTLGWRIRGPGSDRSGWNIDTGDGRSMQLGASADTREGPDDGATDPTTFGWWLEEERDAAGNTIRYEYLRDGGRLYLRDIRWSLFRLTVEYQPRRDALSNGRAGYVRRTGLRGRRITLHSDRWDRGAIREVVLDYADSPSGMSLLTGVRVQSGGVEPSVLPPLTFEYSRVDLSRWSVEPVTAAAGLADLADPSTLLVDLDGDGLPDALTTQGGRTWRWTNQGGGRFDGPRPMSGMPSPLRFGSEQIGAADLDGDGRVELFSVDRRLHALFRLDAEQGSPNAPLLFADAPALPLADPDTRLIDLDGDGVTDLLHTGRTHHLLEYHQAGVGWTHAQAVSRSSDADAFPDVSLSDPAIFLADMTGDGLQDLVRIDDGMVAFWPYLGHGRWAPRRWMTDPPRFSSRFRYRDVHLVDLDGDGCADLVEFHAYGTRIWLNRGGVGFAAPIDIPVAPFAEDGRVLVVDLFGDGRPGFLWTASGRREQRFMRLGLGVKGDLLTRVDNGMGLRYEIGYESTAILQTRGRAERDRWRTTCPFPIHVVTSIVEHDRITERRSERTLHYRDPVYDGPDRCFRGFSEVSVRLRGDASSPASETRHRFFQGDPIASNLVDRERERALAGTLLSREAFAVEEPGAPLLARREERWEARLEWQDATTGVSVCRPLLRSVEQREPASDGGSRVQRTAYLDYDEYGNPGVRILEAFRATPTDDVVEGTLQGTQERRTWTTNAARWLIRLPVRLDVRDQQGHPMRVQVVHYDGPQFVGLDEGEVSAGMTTRIMEAKLFSARLPSELAHKGDAALMGEQVGLHAAGAGDTAGWYAVTSAVRRDAAGNIVETRDPLGHATRIEYDADHLYPVSVANPLGHVTRYAFDPRAGEPLRIEHPDGRVDRVEFDDFGRPLASYGIDDSGREQLVRCWAIDTSSLPAQVTSFAPTSPGWSRAALVATVLEERNDVSVARAYFDGRGQITQQVSALASPLGHASRTFVSSGRRTRDAHDRVHEELAPQFVPDLSFRRGGDVRRRHRYDAAGRLIETWGPANAHQRIRRDAFRIEAFETTDAGTEVLRAVEHYDAFGRLVSIDQYPSDDPEGDVVTTTYDLAADGRIVTIANRATGVLARYTYAGPMGAVKIEHRDAGVRTYWRDAANRVVSRVHADGSSMRWTFDPSGRVVQVVGFADQGGDPTFSRSLVYDGDPGADEGHPASIGKLVIARQDDTILRHEYFPSGRLARISATIGEETSEIGWTYDIQGGRTSVRYPDGYEQRYERGADGNTTSLPGVFERIEYDAFGALVRCRTTDGTTLSRVREPVSGRLLEVSAAHGEQPLRRIRYEYDRMGRISRSFDVTPDDEEAHQYHYDGLSRLVEWRVSGPTTLVHRYAYDPEGNLLERVAHEHDIERRLEFRYEDAVHSGRMTEIVERTASAEVSLPVRYDGQGRVRSVGDLATTEYDAMDGVRRAVRTGAGLTPVEVHLGRDAQDRSAWREVVRDGTSSRTRIVRGIYETDEVETQRHIYLRGVRWAVQRTPRTGGGTTSLEVLLPDRHDTPLLAVAEGGREIARQRHAPFGAPRVAHRALDHFLGTRRDPDTGLSQLGARAYHPEFGRFLSADWYVFEAPERASRTPQAFNAYGYSINNPISFSDPSGRFFVLASLIGFAAGFSYAVAEGLPADEVIGRAFETSFAAGVGAGMGLHTPLGAFGAVSGAFNGIMSGIHQTYDWDSIEGWTAFTLDNSWGIIGTSMGNVIHVINAFGPSDYNKDMSRRQNRHVYNGGIALRKSSAFAQGNVISNAAGTLGSDENGNFNNPSRESLVNRHEDLHVWQNRLFGPLYTTTYVSWLAAGTANATLMWGLEGFDQDLGKMIEGIAYLDNPWEYWGFQARGNWGEKRAEFAEDDLEDYLWG